MAHAAEYAYLPWEYLEEMEELSDAEFGRLARALIAYSKTGQPMALSGNERFYVRRVQAREDRFQAAYAKKASAQAENGSMGGRPKKPSETQEKPTEPNESQEKPTEPNESQPKPKKPTVTVTVTGNEKIPPKSPQGDSGAVPVYPPFPNWPVVTAALDDWLTYKRERKENYKPMGYKSLLTQIRKYVERYGEEAVADLMRESMSANWQGIIWDRLKSKKPEERAVDRYADVVV